MEGEKQGWQAIAAKKKQIQKNLLSQHANYETQVSQCPDPSNPAGVEAFSELVAKLSRGELSCEDVVKEYICRSARGPTPDDSCTRLANSHAVFLKIELAKHMRRYENPLIWKSALKWC